MLHWPLTVRMSSARFSVHYSTGGFDHVRTLMTRSMSNAQLRKQWILHKFISIEVHAITSHWTLNLKLPPGSSTRFICTSVVASYLPSNNNQVWIYWRLKLRTDSTDTDSFAFDASVCSQQQTNWATEGGSHFVSLNAGPVPGELTVKKCWIAR